MSETGNRSVCVQITEILDRRGDKSTRKARPKEKVNALLRVRADMVKDELPLSEISNLFEVPEIQTDRRDFLGEAGARFL